MIDLLEGAGIFIYPLGFCSILAVFIIFERLIALRSGKIIPGDIADKFILGTMPKEGDKKSVAGRIILFFHSKKPDTEQLKAFARVEVNGMERGMFILDIIVSAAPLIGLLGTVTGLVKVFAKINPDTGMPDPTMFVEGVALALTTTMLGLAIAIPALVFTNYLYRRVDTLATRINLGVERLIALSDLKK
jgi:biopolymer transport protein ExbB